MSNKKCWYKHFLYDTHLLKFTFCFDFILTGKYWKDIPTYCSPRCKIKQNFAFNLFLSTDEFPCHNKSCLKENVEVNTFYMTHICLTLPSVAKFSQSSNSSYQQQATSSALLRLALLLPKPATQPHPRTHESKVFVPNQYTWA